MNPVAHLDNEEGLSKENAAFIVRAVNAYERHTKALMRIVSINGSTGGYKSMVEEFKTIAEIAVDCGDLEFLAKAEGRA